MTLNLKKFAITILASLPLAACNNDIFVEDSSPSANKVVIDGDGGIATVTYKEKDLKHIYIGSTDISTSYVKYYDKRGEEVDGTWPSDDLSLIHYESMWITFDVAIKDGVLSFYSTENSSETEQEIFVSLDYEYVVETINVTLLPGEPMRMTSLVFVDNRLDVTPISKIESEARTLRNNSPITQHIEFKPYYGKEGVALLDPENFMANSLEVEVKLPAYKGGKWIIEGGERCWMRLGEKHTYVPENTPKDLTVSVEVPPYTTVRAICGVEYSSATVPFFVHFINPVSGRGYMESGVCTVSEPVGYRIYTEEHEQ